MLTGKGGRDYGVRGLKTNGFMMCNSISDIVDFSQLIKNKGIDCIGWQGY